MNRKSLNILPELNFPTSCNHILSVNNYLITCGSYKPQLKIHNLPLQSLILNRNVRSDPIQIISINGIDQYAVLTNTNYLEMHNQSGMKKMHKIKMNVRQGIYFNSKIIIGGDKNYLQIIDEKDSLIELKSNVNEIRSKNNILGFCGDVAIWFMNDKFETLYFKEGSYNGFDFDGKDYFYGSGTDLYKAELLTESSNNDLNSADHSSVKYLNNVLKENIKIIKIVDSNLIVTSDHEIVILNNKKEIIFNEIMKYRINTIEVKDCFLFVGMDESDIFVFFIKELGEIPDWASFLKDEMNNEN